MFMLLSFRASDLYEASFDPGWLKFILDCRGKWMRFSGIMKAAAILR